MPTEEELTDAPPDDMAVGAKEGAPDELPAEPNTPPDGTFEGAGGETLDGPPDAVCKATSLSGVSSSVSSVMSRHAPLAFDIQRPTPSLSRP